MPIWDPRSHLAWQAAVPTPFTVVKATLSRHHFPARQQYPRREATYMYTSFAAEEVRASIYPNPIRSVTLSGGIDGSIPSA